MSRVPRKRIEPVIAYSGAAFLSLGMIVMPIWIAPSSYIDALPSILLTTANVVCLTIVALSTVQIASLFKDTQARSLKSTNNLLSALLFVALVVNLFGVLTLSEPEYRSSRSIGAFCFAFLWGYALWAHYRYLKSHQRD